MTRIKPLDLEDLPREARQNLEYAKELMGFTPNDVLTMAHWPEFLEAAKQLVDVVYKPGELDPVLKRIKEHKVKLLGNTPIPLNETDHFVLVQDPDGTIIELIGPLK